MKRLASIGPALLQVVGTLILGFDIGLQPGRQVSGALICAGLTLGMAGLGLRRNAASE